ncbi:MAG: amidohydrolase [Bacteroidota bacterium]
MTKHIFTNGNILTQHSGQPRVEALGTAGDKIACTGTLEQVRAHMGSGARETDLKGQTLLPAFNDAHIHIWKVGDLLTYMLDLRDVRSLEEMLDKIADFARKNPENPWIMARGFNEANFPDQRMPERTDLDKVVKDRPCHVIRTCAHVVVLNSGALGICGISRHTPVPAGGEIRMNRDGEPSGVLSETALGLARKFLPAYTPAMYREMILAAQESFLQLGISSATDPAVMPDLLEVYKAMDSAGELKIRINAIPVLVPDGDTVPLPLPAHYRSDFLTVNTVKLFSDGGLSGKTASLKHHYNGGNEQGVLRLDFGFFREIALKAQMAGFKIATHAIGDRAIDLVLQVYESIAGENSRNTQHRIEHLGLPEMSHLTRMKDLGVHCVTQPVFLYELGRNFRNYLPDFYLDNVYPFRSVLEAGVNLAFSSDAPVVKDFSPLTGIRNAVERTDNTGACIAPYQRISVADALKAYTVNAAMANDDGDIKGTLSPGKLADFVILERNPLEIPTEQLSDIKVTGTWTGGLKHQIQNNI